MLAPDFSWSKVKAAVTFHPSDCLVRVRTSANALAWFDVFLNAADGQAYISRYGRWELVEGMPGFEGYEPVKTKVKSLYDTSTNEMVPV
jgi:hypothetical protein